MERDVRLSIIIVNYNTRDLIAACLKSILSDPPRMDFEIIVVDNASRDGSPEHIKAAFPGVKLVENSENAGFARACNQGFRLSTGRHILFLNPDAEAGSAALEHMADFLEKRPDAGIAGAKTVNLDGTVEPSIYYFPTPWRTFVDSFYLHRVFPGLNGFEHRGYTAIAAPRKVEVISGSCFMVKREVLDRVGAFDEELWMYGEDVDLCWRARKAGWNSYYLPSHPVIHKRGTRHLEEGAPHDIERICCSHYRWLYHFFDKHFSPAGRRAAAWIVTVHVRAKLAARNKRLRGGDDSPDNLARISGLTRVLRERGAGQRRG
ncbi:MAG: glycosyltransferase family 2 protein [bacterium]